MIHISRKHRKIAVPVSPMLTNMFPKAPVVTHEGNQLIVLDHGYDETKFLKNIGVPAPAPIMSQYDWVGGTPFEIQKATAALLTTNKRAYVLNSFGTGKTKSALWAWHFLYTNNLCGKLLVIAPLSTLTFTWAAEVFRTLPGIKVEVLHGTKEKRLSRLGNTRADIFIINHDGLGVVFGQLTTQRDINVLCIDELAAYRNNSNRTKLVRKYAANLDWVWGMTGSPTPNAPTDAWNQAAIITPHTVPKYFTRFRDEVMIRRTQFKYDPRPDALDRVYKVLQPAVRFTLNDVMELPQLVERTQDVDMGDEQKKVYDQMAKHARAMVQNGEIDAMNAGACLNKLLQISCGYVYTREGKIIGLDNDKRIDALVDAVLGSQNKVLVFVPYKHALQGIVGALKAEGIDVSQVSGDTPKSERDRIFHAFQNTNLIRVIAAHPATMSHGLTLTAADTIIWFSPTTSLETFEQANARITRVGQRNRQLVLMLQSTKAEKMIYAKLRAKQKIQNTLLGMFEDASDTE